MAFTDITSTSEVRAILGVSVKELPDAVLSLPIYTTQLTEEIYGLHPDLLTDFAVTVALSTKTKDQARFIDLVHSYAAYFIAKLCLGSVAMFAPMLIDAAGKSQLQRVADPYAALRADVPTVLGILRVNLRNAYAKINLDATPPTAAERLYVLASPLAVNPITG